MFQMMRVCWRMDSDIYALLQIFLNEVYDSTYEPKIPLKKVYENKILTVYFQKHERSINQGDYLVKGERMLCDQYFGIFQQYEKCMQIKYQNRRINFFARKINLERKFNLVPRFSNVNGTFLNFSQLFLIISTLFSLFI